MPAQRFPRSLPNFQRNGKLATHLCKVLDELYETLGQLEYNPIPPEPLEVSDAMTPRKKPSLFRKIFPPIHEGKPTRIIDAWQICSIATSSFSGVLHLDAQNGSIYVSGGVPVAVPIDYAKLLLLSTDDLLEITAEVDRQVQTMTKFVSVLTTA